jgi:hypothetical protein
MAQAASPADRWGAATWVGFISADTEVMADLPSGQPPRIVSPVSGVMPAGHVGGGGGGRRDDQATYQDRRPPPAPASDGRSAPAAGADPGPPDIPDPLVQALDRLRATNQARPVDDEFARLLRGKREYLGHPPSPGALILPDPPPVDPG